MAHYYLSPAAAAGAAAADPARAGFVVGRAVGGSVVRHRVLRRLRHLVRDRRALLPTGSRLVVRALPPARDADSATLGRDLDAALARLLTPAADPAAVAPTGAAEPGLVPPSDDLPASDEDATAAEPLSSVGGDDGLVPSDSRRRPETREVSR